MNGFYCFALYVSCLGFANWPQAALAQSAAQAPEILYVVANSADSGEAFTVVSKVNPGGAATTVRVDWSPNGTDFVAGTATVVDGAGGVLATNVIASRTSSEAARFRVSASNSIQVVSTPLLRLRTGVTMVKNDAATLADALGVPNNPIRFASDGQFTAALPVINNERTIDGEDHTIVITGGGLTVGDSGVVTLRHLNFKNCAVPQYLAGALRNLGNLRVTGCRFVGNQSHTVQLNPALGGAIANGDYYPGRIYNARCSVENCYFQENFAQAGTYPGPVGVRAYGGAIFNNGQMTISGCTFSNNLAKTLTIVPNAFGFGGAIANWGMLDIVNSTFLANTIANWQPVNQNSSDGGAFWQGVNLQASSTLRFSTFVGNGFATIAGGNVNMYGCIIQAGTPTNDVAFRNPPIDLGYNIASDDSGSLTGVGSSQGIDAKVEEPGDNGGSTPTVALKTDSPARDAIPLPGAIAFDQRGVPRSQGTRVDIGAVEMIDESKAQLIVFTDERVSARVAVSGAEPKRVDTTVDFVNWLSLGLFTPAGGLLKFEERAPGAERRFYRIAPLQ
jgi:hypothetical protein